MVTTRCAYVNSNDKPIANPTVVLRDEFDDWAVLFDPETGTAFGLNPTAVYLWRLLDGRHSIDDMVETLRRDAEGVPEDAGDHVSALVGQLAEQRLVGFVKTEFGLRRGPEKSSYSFLEAWREVKPFSFEPPILTNLNSEQAAYGATCGNGSGANSCCSTGNLATSNCYTGNSRSAAYPCCSGTCGQPDSCGCGGCDGYCDSGSSGGRWCYGGLPACTSGCDVQMVNCTVGH